MEFQQINTLFKDQLVASLIVKTCVLPIRIGLFRAVIAHDYMFYNRSPHNYPESTDSGHTISCQGQTPGSPQDYHPGRTQGPTTAAKPGNTSNPWEEEAEEEPPFTISLHPQPLQ